MRLIDADALEKRFEYLATVGNDLVHKVTEEEKGVRTAFRLAKYETHVAPTIAPESLQPQWIPVTERLPKTSKQYLVTVDELRWPKNTYDSVDSPTERLFVTSMHFDCTNRLWHDSDGFVINALIDPEDVLNGYVAVAWLPLPEPYKEDEHD